MLIPASAFAWGPLTHIYLGNELYSFAAMLPAGFYQLIKKHKKDFIYGNIMADIIFGKQYLPDHKSSHNWEVAFKLLRSAKTDQHKAFVYGYLSHLAADTVAHNLYTHDKKNIRHTLLEMKADSIINKKYWIQAMSIDRKTQKRNDLFIEHALERLVFSFKTNKRIVKGMVLFSIMNQERVVDFIDKSLITSMPDRKIIQKLQRESLSRIIDLCQNFENSEVININPNGCIRKGRIASALQKLNTEVRARKFINR